MANKNLRWMRLDNAGLIFPAARRKNWTNVYRISMTFSDPIDSDMLDIAIRHVMPRFPSMAVRIRPGFFWYYLEEVPEAPRCIPEETTNINKMTWKELKKNAFRVLYFKNRISVELFHSLTDGTGGMIFAKTLCAEYIRLKYRTEVAVGNGVLPLDEKPSAEELEDSFKNNYRPYHYDPELPDAFMPGGTVGDGRLHVVTGILDTDALLSLSRGFGTTLTCFLAACMMKSFYDLQNAAVPEKKRKFVSILIPVNLRRLFCSGTLRNFASYVTPGINPRIGEYTLEEMIKVISGTMSLYNDRKMMAAKFSYNVKSEISPVLRMAPLFMKNIAMRSVYNKVGEKKSCICLSNLGKVDLPEGMEKYVLRVEFILGAQADSHNNCSVCSYNGKTYINFVRNIEESEVERLFFTYLRKLGLHVLVESNESSEV